MLDDRGERPGAMFADWELIGVPLRVVISDRGLKAGTVEVQGRRDAAASVVPLAEVAGPRQGPPEGMTGTAADAPCLRPLRVPGPPSGLLAPARAGAQHRGAAGRCRALRAVGRRGRAAPPKPRFDRSRQRLAYLRWLGEASERLKRARPSTRRASNSSRPCGTKPARRPGPRWCWA
jgi:hypothetical protein